MAKFIDLNCDMGESYGRWTLGADEEIMPHITSANVACGFHGGDPHVMRTTVALALKHNVATGSHPSLPDLIGFGRRTMDVSPAELKDYLCYQTGRKMGIRVASEGFADRAYNVDLSLVSRKLPGSLITDPKKAADQAVR